MGLVTDGEYSQPKRKPNNNVSFFTWPRRPQSPDVSLTWCKGMEAAGVQDELGAGEVEAVVLDGVGAGLAALRDHLNEQLRRLPAQQRLGVQETCRFIE